MFTKFQFTGKLTRDRQPVRKSQCDDASESQTNPAETPSRSHRRPTRRLRLLALSLAGATCALVLGAGAASAASGPQWSPRIAPQYWQGYFGNCNILSGPVYDPYTTSDGRFAVIGGGQLSCSTIHSYQVRTQEYFSRTGAGTSYYLQSDSGWYSAANYGFPTGIQETGRLCGTGYWFTRVTVSVAGYSTLYFDSNPHYVAATLC
jgi:hypothetical protein